MSYIMYLTMIAIWNVNIAMKTSRNKLKIK